MSGRIAWGSYPGEDIERLVATYICTKHPDANHIRPSIRDRGIDLFRTLDDGTVSIYQIKRFSSNLTFYRQIENATELATRKRLVHYWERLRIDQPSFVLPDTPQLLQIIRPLSFEIGGNAYECGLVESIAIAHMVEAGDSLIMAPVEEYGDQMVTTATLGRPRRLL